MHAEMRSQEPAGGAVAHRITGRVIAISGALPLIVGVRVLIGYWFSWPLNAALFPRAAGLRANTALCLTLLGAALCAQRAGAPTRLLSRAAVVGAARLVLLVAVLTLTEYAAGVELGIDDLLVHGQPSPRMSPITACALACLAWSMLVSQRRAPAPAWLLQTLLGASTLLSLLPIMGYLYGAPTLYAVAGRTAITPLAAVGLGALSFGVFALRADEGLWLLLSGDNAGSALARRALPAVVVLPTVFGLLRLEAEAFGALGLELGVALSAAATVLTFAALVLWSAYSLRAQHLARQAAVARLRDARNTLELRVEERTQELSHSEAELRSAAAELTVAKQRAEAATRARADFLARMSHEMRTPLNGMVGMLEVALRGELAAAQRDQLQTAHASAETLLYLINDILEFSKIDAGKLGLEIAPFRLRDTLAAALRAHAGAAHEKNLELVLRVTSDVPECLLGDARRLCQVVTNLVGNAIKFTARGQIELELQSVERTGTRALLRAQVSDTGIGVAKDKQSLIFEAFAQADETTTRRFGGTGLGLAICAELVQLMDGAIGVESEPGRGSRFCFTFAIEVDEAAERERFRAPFSAQRVLLIEPHAGHREFLCALLEEWGLEVHTSAPLDAANRLRDAARRGAGFALLIIDSDGVAHLGASFFSRLRSSIGELCPSLQLTRARFARAARGPGAELGSLELSKPVAPSALLEGIAGLLGTRSEPEPKPVTAGAAPPLSVLLAEDNEVNRRVAQFLLEEAGCRVTPVMDGKQALSALAAQRFDVVLMDGHMPEMDGLEAVGVLRARERESGGRTPVIALTAQAMHGDRERYLAAGMDAYLSKPFTGRVLIETVREVVARGAAREAAAADTSAPALADSVGAAALALGAPSAAAGPDTSTPAYARARLLDRVGDNEPLLRQMVCVFWEEAPELLQAVSKALEAGDARQLERSAHKCVGALLTIGAEAAGRTARSLELVARTGELARAPSMVETLTHELRALEQAFVTAGDLVTDQRDAPPAARIAR